jgi:two-component system, LytTR family, sensor histidine kinase AlgZ
MVKSIGFWSRLAAGNAAGALLAVLVFSGATWQTPWRQILTVTATTFGYSFCCSSLGFLAIPRLAPIVWRRLPTPFNWAAIAAALVACAAAGCLIAVLLRIALGLTPPDRALIAWQSSLKTAIYFTLIFGIFFTVTGGLKSRLDQTALALRTKERDEAQAQRLAAEAQLASLESRVDPHFLFNTLNSVSELVHENPAAAERVVGQLASLMRSSLERGAASLVPLEQEIGFVQKYLEIERVRFGERLRYTLAIAGDAARTPVPRLSVQTLVENSVKHAVSARRDGAAIAVRALNDRTRTRIEVEDDGPGFDGGMPAGHGLALLEARLKMQFGGDATVRVETAPGRTCVRLDVPLASA